MHNDGFDMVLPVAMEKALEFLTDLDSRRVAARSDARSLRTKFLQALPDEGLSAREVVEHVAAAADDGLLANQSGRFFGWVIGGTLPSALAVDWLTSAWNQNATDATIAPSAAVAEEVAGRWLKEILGLPADASFAFVTGCSMAHVTCLAAARNALLANRSWDVECRGLFGAPPIRVISSVRRHASINRALRLLGIGTASLDLLDPGDKETIDPRVLQATLERESSTPTIVLLQAGDVNTGASDAFATLIPIARAFGAWVHVDGAFGLWANASPSYRHLTEGIERADSWATDGHKWLNVPYGSGYAFVSDTVAHRRAMTLAPGTAPYMIPDLEARNQLDWTPEWSRRARGFATYAALLQLGRNGVVALIDRSCASARSIVDKLSHLPGVEVLWYPNLNQALFRILDPSPGVGDAEHSRRTDEVLARVNAGGQAYLTPTMWRDKRAIRLSVVNWQTSVLDVERTVEAFAAAIKETRYEQQDSRIEL